MITGLLKWAKRLSSRNDENEPEADRGFGSPQHQGATSTPNTVGTTLTTHVEGSHDELIEQKADLSPPVQPLQVLQNESTALCIDCSNGGVQTPTKDRSTKENTTSSTPAQFSPLLLDSISPSPPPLLTTTSSRSSGSSFLSSISSLRSLNSFSPPTSPTMIQPEIDTLKCNNAFTSIAYHYKTTTSPLSFPVIVPLPTELLIEIFNFLTPESCSYYRTLSLVSRQFSHICKLKPVMKMVDFDSDGNRFLEASSGGGIEREEETVNDTLTRLEPWVEAGNNGAIHMSGMIRCYCTPDIRRGAILLSQAANNNHAPSSYALGLILRDNDPAKSREYFVKAASVAPQFAPAMQELVEEKVRLRNDELQVFLKCRSLHRFISRQYTMEPRLRHVMTSHCWHPMCGRWGYRLRSRGIHNGTENDNSNEGNALLAASSDDTNGDLFLTKQQRQLRQQQSLFPTLKKTSRMKMCGQCRKAKYCSKLCQVSDWRGGRHRKECNLLNE